MISGCLIYKTPQVFTFAFFPARISPLVSPTYNTFLLFNFSLASKIPCIISNEVALGIPGLVNGKNILIANTMEDYLKYFKLTLENKEKIDKIVENGYKLIKEHYSWKKHVGIIENIWANEVVKKWDY